MQIITCVFEKFVPSEDCFKFFKLYFNTETLERNIVVLKDNCRYEQVIDLLQKLNNLWKDKEINGIRYKIILDEGELDKIFND